MYTLIYYRENWEIGYNDYTVDSCDSKFEIMRFDDIQSLAKFIYNKLSMYPLAQYNNIIFTGNNFDFDGYIDSPSQGLYSIRVKISDDDTVNVELENYVKSEIRKLGWKE